MNELYFHRTQFAIGQGGFHATRLVDPVRRTEFTFVYDCGSLNAAKLREREIAEFFAGHARFRHHCYWGAMGRHPDRIDLVVLSHIDADHVNGLARLLEHRAPGSQTVILLPYLEWWDRLAQFDSHSDGGQAAVDLISDPVEYLSRTDGVRVVTVSAAQLELPEVSEYVPLNNGDQDAEVAIYVSPASTAGNVVNGATLKPGRDSPWVFKVFVPPVVNDTRAQFVERLAKLIPEWAEHFHRGLSSAEVSDLLLHHASQVRLATVQASADQGGPNATSLVVYSGPDPGSSPAACRSIRCWLWTQPPYGYEGYPDHTAWLHTGDAPLGDSATYESLRSAMERYLPHVGVVMLPHHGSRNGFSWPLIEDCGARAAVACSGPRKGWRHPDPELWHSLALSGVGTVHVSSAEHSRLHECGLMYW